MDTTPARPARSARRTSHIDMNLDVEPPAGLVLEGAARDVRTVDGSAEVTDEASVRAVLDRQHQLIELETNPTDEVTAALVGRLVGTGFRSALLDAAPHLQAAASPLFLLLDDLPVAALISGYARLYTDDLGQDHDPGALKADICAGWAGDATMMVALRQDGRIPVPYGPPTNALERPDDAHSWHPIGPLAHGAMRRRRLVDVSGGDELSVFAMFRDTYSNATGHETIVHEYSLRATVDAPTMTFTSCVATAQVLPWVECPAAAASAGRLVGRRVDEVRELVRRDLRGTSTCTHLNDLLRSLGDVGPLARSLATPMS